MSAVLKNYVGGAWVDGASTTRNINPSNTADVVGEYAKGNKEQVAAAIAAAKAAFPGWSRSTPGEEADAVDRAVEHGRCGQRR